MINFKKISLILFFLLGNFYFLLPLPPELPPLPNSLRSDEPGDTVQIKGVSAFYTDLSREEVVDFYTKAFSRSTFMNLPLITYRLNHPPERIREVLRPTQFSTYVEEVVHPLRGSLFVNGYEWEEDPFTLPKQRTKNILIVNGKTYRFKITLFVQYSFWWQRLIVFWGGCLVLVLITSALRRIIFGVPK